MRRTEMDENFEQNFCDWLKEGLSQRIPKTVKAFCFNLSEPAGEEGVKFGIELIGAGSFHVEDSDWPCDEVWEPETRWILIPISYSGEKWEQCLRKMKKLVLKQLETDSNEAKKLKLSQGIGIGFVDGDLEIIWKREFP